MARRERQFMDLGPMPRNSRPEPLSQKPESKHDHNDPTRDALPNTAHFAFFVASGEYLSTNRTQIRNPCTVLKAGRLAILGFVGKVLVQK